MRRRTGWLSEYTQDVARYTTLSRGPALVQVLTQQGLWALLQYRISSVIFRSNLPPVLRRPLLVVAVIGSKFMEVLTGISLPYSASIGPGLYIGHFGNIIIGGDAVIGENCNISQGVTVGQSGRGALKGTPRIGDRVYIGANAVVVGRIHVGNDAVVGANSLVTTDVPGHATVVGVPARVTSLKGSEGYIILDI